MKNTFKLNIPITLICLLSIFSFISLGGYANSHSSGDHHFCKPTQCKKAHYLYYNIAEASLKDGGYIVPIYSYKKMEKRVGYELFSSTPIAEVNGHTYANSVNSFIFDDNSTINFIESGYQFNITGFLLPGTYYRTIVSGTGCYLGAQGVIKIRASADGLRKITLTYND